MKHQKREGLIFCLFILWIGIYYRLIPHPPNFSPLIPITVFSGFILPQYTNKYLPYLIPLIILISSDLILGLHNQIFTVYFAFLSSVYLSRVYFKFFKVYQEKSNLKKIFHANISSLVNSTWFYIFSNFGVWLTTNMYPKTMDGLIQCYVMAIPFFKNSIISSILFCTLIFGIYYYFKLETISHSRDLNQEN